MCDHNYSCGARDRDRGLWGCEKPLTVFSFCFFSLFLCSFDVVFFFFFFALGVLVEVSMFLCLRFFECLVWFLGNMHCLVVSMV